ncbi:adaptor protein MecA [Thermaerobacillus caldiproteolyticus]|uniref:Adapter protein MecA n=1 Tax=Thermaerobacillus caldiproteolyticus TaxID=247480 RepID=A0A7V9Z6H3_9BACL|nr:adaptor protein MecA [Anoxybacillus caldiproteolyticus]MBA2874934.1 adapter protein MecA 1/2 [Anoxybacillus caldiproteolyticus]QPA31732.1 adaptor protein MecA [Anoxybacillus caldiproteolyticus]
MEMERINEHTVKFYISYVDIEERGFDREEIWYNRERSEELFWEMMDEVHSEGDFSLEGPLWIQVQALDKGLEVLVTKAQLSKDGSKLELPLPEEKVRDFPVDEKIEELLDHHFHIERRHDTFLEEDDEVLHFTICFKDIEDMIALAHRADFTHLKNRLFFFEGRYYLFVEFNDEDYTEHEIDNWLSLLLEYGTDSQVTIYRLEEYGKEIIHENALATLAHHFPLT